MEESAVRSPGFNSLRIIYPIGSRKMGRSNTVKLTEAPREIARVVELQQQGNFLYIVLARLQRIDSEFHLTLPEKSKGRLSCL